jgi:hypothetical protein
MKTSGLAGGFVSNNSIVQDEILTPHLKNDKILPNSTKLL